MLAALPEWRAFDRLQRAAALASDHIRVHFENVCAPGDGLERRGLTAAPLVDGVLRHPAGFGEGMVMDTATTSLAVVRAQRELEAHPLRHGRPN